MFRRKNRQNPQESTGGAKPPKASLRPESLEDRILLSGTWVDADGDAIDGPTDGADGFTGDELADIAEGGGGDDILFGNGGNDFLDGGAGDDQVHGGAGNDVVAGGEGDDLLTGGTGDDLIVGGDGNDTVSYADSDSAVNVNLANETATGQGNDTVVGVENVIGSQYGDTLDGDDAANTIEGGAGADVIDGGAGSDTLVGGSGNDTIDGGSGADVITGGTGHDVLRGGSGNDTIDGGTGNDTIDAGSGNDLILGSAGNDVIDGGTGFDTVDYSAATGSMNVNLANQTATGMGSDTIRNVEKVIGGNSADTITGDGAANVLIGGQGDDTLSGGAGNDTLEGGEGDDTLVGGAGSDTLKGGAGDDTIFADEFDTIQGGDGTDSVNFSQATGPVTFDASVASIEHVVGSSHNDVFAFTAAQAGDVYTLDGGGGYNVIDLSGFDVSAVEIDAEAGVATVNLGNSASFEIHFENIDHIAIAGVNAPVLSIDAIVGQESSPVEVHAMGLSGSTGELTYTWTQVSGPAISLDSADTASPSFMAPELSASTTIRLQVEVSDGTSTSTQVVTIGISATNDPVVLDAGPGQLVSEGDPVTLNATA
ncbi:MAG: hypothetical protein ACIAQU_01205, partial [Phycisphaerales bacterium JB064]